MRENVSSAASHTRTHGLAHRLLEGMVRAADDHDRAAEQHRPCSSLLDANEIYMRKEYTNLYTRRVRARGGAEGGRGSKWTIRLGRNSWKWDNFTYRGKQTSRRGQPVEGRVCCAVLSYRTTPVSEIDVDLGYHIYLGYPSRYGRRQPGISERDGCPHSIWISQIGHPRWILYPYPR